MYEAVEAVEAVRRNRMGYLKAAKFYLVQFIISFGLGSPEVAPYMTGTFGEVFGPRNQTGSEPRLARK